MSSESDNISDRRSFYTEYNDAALRFFQSNPAYLDVGTFLRRALLSRHTLRTAGHPREAVLDVGSRFLPYLSVFRPQRSRRPATYIALDLVPLPKVRRLVGSAAIFVCADGSSLPFRSAAFDVVLCIETLEHMPDDRQALTELSRVLRPRGVAILSAPLANPFPLSVSWFAKRRYHSFPNDRPVGHLRRYTPQQLHLLCQTTGLHPGPVAFYGHLLAGYLSSLSHRLLSTAHDNTLRRLLRSGIKGLLLAELAAFRSIASADGVIILCSKSSDRFQDSSPQEAPMDSPRPTPAPTFHHVLG